jgi:hypothetical protein
VFGCIIVGDGNNSKTGKKEANVKSANKNLQAGLVEAEAREKDRHQIVYLQESLDRALGLLAATQHNLDLKEVKVAELEAVIRKDEIMTEMLNKQLELVIGRYDRLSVAYHNLLKRHQETFQKLNCTFDARVKLFLGEVVLAWRRRFPPKDDGVIKICQPGKLTKLRRFFTGRKRAVE